MKSPNNFALISLLQKFAYKASHYKANLSLRHNFFGPLINFYLPGRHSDFFSIEKQNENRDKRVKSKRTDTKRYKQNGSPLLHIGGKCNQHSLPNEKLLQL